MAKNPKISNALAIASCDAMVDRLDLGASGGFIDIYDGAQPIGGPDESVTTQVKLARLTLSKPAFGNASDANPGALAIGNPISDDTSADATGTASWFRALDSDEIACIDGTVGVVSGFDMIIDDTSIVIGQTVKVNSFTVLMKESN